MVSNRRTSCFSIKVKAVVVFCLSRFLLILLLFTFWWIYYWHFPATTSAKMLQCIRKTIVATTLNKREAYLCESSCFQFFNFEDTSIRKKSIFYLKHKIIYIQFYLTILDYNISLIVIM